MRDVPDEGEDGLPDISPDDPAEQETYFRKLRGGYPGETAGMSHGQLMRIIRDGLIQCPPLGIRKPRDVLRFLALSLLITPEQKNSNLLETVIRSVLEAVEDWSATKRLDFVYRHVVRRPPPNPEPDFGPWFVERAQEVHPRA